MKEGFNCSFCGRPKAETSILIAGIDAHMCEHCVEQAHGIVMEEVKSQNGSGLSDEALCKKPRGIRAVLDGYVVDQEQTTKVLSAAVHNPYERLLQHDAKNDVEIEKTSIIVLGQTGTGTTLVANAIARMLNVPLGIVDA